MISLAEEFEFGIGVSCYPASRCHPGEGPLLSGIL